MRTIEELETMLYDESVPGSIGISCEEAALLMGCNSRTLRKWRARGAFPSPIRRPGKIVYTLASIRTFLDRQTKESAEAARRSARLQFA